MYRHVGGLYDLVAVGVEGDAPGSAPRYAVVGPKDEDSHALHEQHAGPLVGRQAELAALDAALATLRAGGSQVVSLVAEPGLGKSKLLAVWLERSRGRGALAGVTVLRGLGVAYGSAPGATLRSLLRAADGEAAAAVAAVAELRAHAQPTVTAGALAAWLARCGPALLVVDDLHWADDASLAALLRQRQGRTPAAVRLARRAWACFRPRQSVCWQGTEQWRFFLGLSKVRPQATHVRGLGTRGSRASAWACSDDHAIVHLRAHNQWYHTLLARRYLSQRGLMLGGT
ncbi:MAG: ATP-binding protein [Chloroflexi bacterium]|nr:ATP-binding protein [Chloroflexota bacterium]